MNTKHTPGPWVISERVKTARLDNALMVRPVNEGDYEFGATAIIVTSEGNARLIAAAPDLLALLQSMADGDIMTTYPTTHAEVVHEYQKLARAAVAKAIGEAK